MESLAIVAWYGLLLVGPQWELVGPYADRTECTQVIEYLDAKGHETETCTMASTDNESIYIWLPKAELKERA